MDGQPFVRPFSKDGGPKIALDPFTIINMTQVDIVKVYNER